MNAIPAIYENGVFRPIFPVDLPEKTRVEVLLLSASSSQEFDRAKGMIALGADELDRGERVPASEVFAEIVARRDRLQAERASPQ